MTAARAVPLTIKGATGGGNASVALPSHSVGDLIIVYASSVEYNVVPTVPTASGTVPTWTTIGTPVSTDRARMVYTIATATNHTSGTFGGSTWAVMAVVLSGQSTSPIGGYAYTGGNGSLAPAIPALSNSTGSSKILHFVTTSNKGNTRSTLSGYTQLADGATTYYDYRVASKDVTTSDGSLTMLTTNGSYGSGASLEVLA